MEFYKNWLNGFFITACTLCIQMIHNPSGLFLKWDWWNTFSWWNVQVNTKENLIKLVPQYPIMCKKYVSNQIKDIIWLEMTENLGYDDSVADIYLQTLDVGMKKEK